MRKQSLRILVCAFAFITLTLFVMCSKKNVHVSDPPARSAVAELAAVTYQLIWSDEFDGTSVNTGKWNIDNGNPNVNNELEYYQAANAAVTGGNLVITARQQSMGGQPYTSAKLNSYGKFSVTYGRIEARIKLPMVQGTWPAFWMLGNNINTGAGWPTCGEIDIMEH
ncbi:MAG TPA: glycoside hydrolase family 16 protein, partial [Niastella sp.]